MLHRHIAAHVMRCIHVFMFVGTMSGCGGSTAPPFVPPIMDGPALPVIHNLGINSAPEIGGDSVIITGTGFTGATAVTFGATPAASFTVNSDKQITAVTPSVPPSTVEIQVTTPVGTSATDANHRFTFTFSIQLSAAVTTSASVNSLTLTTRKPVPAGDVVVVAFGFRGTNVTYFGIVGNQFTDSANNGYIAGAANGAAGRGAVDIFISRLTNALPRGSTITIPLKQTQVDDVTAAIAYHFPGVTASLNARASDLDQASTTTPAFGAGDALSGDTVVSLFVAFNTGGSIPGGTFTAGNGLTALPGASIFSATRGLQLCVLMGTTTSNNANTNGVFSTSSAFMPGIISFK